MGQSCQDTVCRICSDEISIKFMWQVVSNSQESCWFNLCPLHLISVESTPVALYTSHHLTSFQPSLYVKEGQRKSFGIMSWHFSFLDSIKLQLFKISYGRKANLIWLLNHMLCPALLLSFRGNCGGLPFANSTGLGRLASSHHLILDHSFANAGLHFVSLTSLAA